MRSWILVVAAFAGCTHSSGPPDFTSIDVTDTTLIFDPATCAVEHRTLGLGLGSARVEIIERRNERCIFEFTHEVEGGYTKYTVSVPVDSGPVEIRAQGDGADVATSFDLSQATIVRRGNVFFD